ncbi:MAG TPA: hypothetical protein VLC79_06980 [Cellvibrio sp.]|nr:hypothetical protein [Cellvibrio sp.]
MTDEHKSTRLGDLLVERGVITRTQLLRAIELQQQRREQALPLKSHVSYKQELGEILIELGFISRKELTSSLSWQKRLRKTTAVMVFIAPLLTAACGGGGGSSGADKVQAQTPSSQSAVANPGVDKPSVTSSAHSAIVSSLSSSSTASISATVTVKGPVQIYWSAPLKRENGDYLDIAEVGGYELRYRRTSDTRYTSITIDDRYTDTYYFDNLEGEYEFQIAAYDVNGIYSPFVQIRRM